ncbi:hypothetical protein [Pseudoalteromonas ruthenica]|uniref:Uncharacterized protein n=1 Tax=Pseudoalteromonas ruthenica TaxID=151081 RepID=A0A0F4PRH9_9GAMM|nr:hypothetical protein [Pseudoalteromonas ruthenica]KJY97648.1 hypothetical protein TW76_07400 [Pseudoalteromonas ruthenica]KJZ01675.1 hypothetical protein TW72_01615 [Pseudoalteromonas ruthenica]TMO94930.1 hypothetical protein CWC13_01855 [Pseudoalteromonas ruthenica]TMO97045.1 hypothetical protein CWC07_15330 [Pseudoalteromonas ruthenica]TMP06429.1 hypothetical protein CWC09_11885 [Pseudoalteromonas ruthenica]
MKKKQARLNPDLEKEICSQILLLASRSNNGKVTWTKLEEMTGFSRQALSANSVIANEYREINAKQKSVVTAECRVAEVEAKLAKAQAECKRLKATLKEYDAKYARWLYNATNANLSVDELNAPIPESIKTAGRKKGRK